MKPILSLPGNLVRIFHFVFKSGLACRVHIYRIFNLVYLRKRSVILFNAVLLTFYTSAAIAQSGQAAKVTPVSPEAATLAKMINFPVSYNTGVPDISIPLYEIKAGNLSLPVTLNYHAGGFKIQERATSVGLGWSSSTDLQISRTVNGLDDFAPNGYIGNPLMKVYDSANDYPLYSSSSTPFSTIESYRIAAGDKDGMPDKFYYKLLNKSGSFYFRKTSSGMGYTIVPVPYENIKITFNAGQFTIIDTDGTTYYFGVSGTGLNTDNVDVFATELTGSAGVSVRTAFKCTRIENATKTNALDFTYVKKTRINFASANQYVEYFNNPNAGSSPYWYTSDNLGGIYNSYEHLTTSIPFYNLSSPKWIEHYGYGQQKFYFPYVLNGTSPVVNQIYNFQNAGPVMGESVYGIALSRIDFNGGAVFFNGADKINDIVVKNTSNEEIKTFSLFQSYAVPANLSFAQTCNGPGFAGTPYLDSVQFKAGGTRYGSYKLKYDNKFCFGNHIQGKDAWGFTNTYSQERSYGDTYLGVPEQNITQEYFRGPNGGNLYIAGKTFTFGNPKNTENTDSSPISRGMLTRIIYPTGGYTNFGYESNMIRLNLPDSLSRVVMTGGLRIKSITNFEGNSTSPVSQKYYRYGELEDGIGLAINPPRSYSITNNAQANNLDAFTYTQTVGYVTGPGTVNAGKDFAPVPIGCSNRGCLMLRIKEDKTVYNPASFMDYTYPTGSPIYYTKVTEYNADLGRQTGKKVYTYSKPNEYDPYNYYDVSKIPGTNIDMLQTDGLMGMPKSVEDFKFENGRYQLAHSKTSTYVKRSIAEQIRVVYAYFKTVYKIIGGTYTGNSFDLYNTNYEFSAGSLPEPDLYTSGQYGIQVAKLLLSTENESWVTNNGTVNQSTTYEYENSQYNQLSKITVTNSSGSTAKAFKYAYDFPGVSIYDQMTTANRISDAIEIVETNGSSEVSRVKNNYGSFNNSAFITLASVQTSYGGNPLDTVLTCDFYDQKANLLQQTANRKKIRSYLWAYNYQHPVAEFSGETYANATAGVDVASLQALTDDAQIKSIVNARRTALPDAMVSTFFYKPLTGVTTETNPGGRSVFYNYDGFGRLSNIKNDDLNIIKKYDYHYISSISALSNNLLYASSPMMRTYNNVRIGDTVTMNAYIYGGKYLNADWKYADSDAESDLPFGAFNSPNTNYKDYFSIPATVGIRLSLNLVVNNSQPTDVYLDFIKDNSVVFTKKFPSVSYGSPVTLKIEPGQYKLGIRYNENYNGSVTAMLMESPNGAQTYIRSGYTIQFSKWQNYNFILKNYW